MCTYLGKLLRTNTLELYGLSCGSKIFSTKFGCLTICARAINVPCEIWPKGKGNIISSCQPHGSSRFYFSRPSGSISFMIVGTICLGTFNDVSILEHARYNDTQPGYLLLASPAQYTVEQFVPLECSYLNIYSLVFFKQTYNCTILKAKIKIIYYYFINIIYCILRSATREP